jgi:hypothetical protein
MVDAVQMLTLHPPADIKDSRFLRLIWQTTLERIDLAATRSLEIYMHLFEMTWSPITDRLE